MECHRLYISYSVGKLLKLNKQCHSNIRQINAEEILSQKEQNRQRHTYSSEKFDKEYNKANW